ncbi:TRAF-interacting protein with FHA domain-containing protein A [Salarias fasciatus]|uniref:TRAF-interacting protein with FHA domain-containing protein A n=1 Tax=Salarias fasciatus TaxID=181472 RepID=A0A672FFZ8_SALFA|nr:TRAF-interacting protein with FHA domain-containing protein A [Salarias fasciatus]
MNVNQTLETEEDLLTCLRIQVHHPQQNSRGLFRLLPVDRRTTCSADDPLRLGRDSQSCTFALEDPRVSRKQLALHAYRSARCPDLLFCVQNLSQRGRMSVNGSALGYLERLDLPDKALVRFGEYQLLLSREPGEAKASFEVEFEVLNVPPSRETIPSAPPCRETAPSVPSMTPVAETGYLGDQRSAGPLEVDESLIYDS